MAVVFVALVMLGAASVALGGDCTSQPSAGLCQAYIPRYFFNSTSGSCEHFIYGGCGGNANNHKTLEECEESCGRLSLEDCSAEPEVGMCRAAFPRFYFDIKTGSCQKFIYGGCGGNKNSFGDEKECQTRCGQYVNNKEMTLEECSAEAETGMCRAYIPSFAFNPRTGKCESFIYGGCGGNANNFQEEKTCLDSCGKYAALPDPVPEVVCTEEPEVGLCRAAVPRYFWNHRIGVCQPFTYGGCGGNTNNFESSSECHDACKGTPVANADCNAQPDGGMCFAYFPSYFYNSTSGQCENFIYGGCAGNSNRFQTLTSCIHTCAQPIPVVDERLAVGNVGVCGQPKKVGLCKAAFPRFFYNEATGSCEKFIYGGCGANENNFKTLEECHNTCLA